MICLGTSLQIEPSALLPATCLLSPRPPPAAASAAARPFAALSRTLRNWTREKERELKRRRKTVASAARNHTTATNGQSITGATATPQLKSPSEASQSTNATSAVAARSASDEPNLDSRKPGPALPNGTAQRSAVQATPHTSVQKQELKQAVADADAHNGPSGERERHLVIVNLQETAFDAQCSVRIFARIETVLSQLLAALLPPPLSPHKDEPNDGPRKSHESESEPEGNWRAGGADGCALDLGPGWPSLDEAALARLARGHEPAVCTVCAGVQSALATRHLSAAVTRIYK